MTNPELYISKGQKVITSVKASGGDVLEKIKAIRSCTCRDAHNTLHRAHRKDEGHHPVRRFAGLHLQGLRLCYPWLLCAGLCLQGAKEVARPSRKWKNWSFMYTKLKNAGSLSIHNFRIVIFAVYFGGFAFLLTTDKQC